VNSKGHTNIDSIGQRADETNVLSYLTYDKIVPGTFIFDNESTYGFILKLNPFSGIASKDINALTKIVSYEIPSEAIVQVINYASDNIEPIVNTWSDVIKNNNCTQDIYSSLTEKRKQFFLSGCNTGLWGKSSEFVLRDFELYFSVSWNKLGSDRSNADLIRTIGDVKTKVEKAFSNIGCRVESLNMNSLDSYLSKILIPGTNTPFVFGNSTANPEYTMYPEYVQISQDKTTRKYILFEIDDWPGTWSINNGTDYVGNFQSGRGLPFPFYISFGYKSEDQRESERQATKARIIRTNQTTAKLVSFVPAMKEEVEDWNDITAEIDKGAKLAKACMYIVAIIDESIDEKGASQTVLDHFYQLGFKLNQIRYDCLNHLLHTLPMQQAEKWSVLKKSKALTTMITSACMNLLPIFADAQNSTTPLMMFAGRRGQVFFFDNYASVENGNYNMVVVGKSGSGKSVFLQEYMTSILRTQGQVVVIDDGRSFQNSCKILGGDFVDFVGDKICINPFSLYPDHSEATNTDKFKVDFEEPLIDLIVSILCIITNIDKNDNRDFNIGLYRDVLRKAVQIVLQEKKGKGNFKDVYQVLQERSVIRTSETEHIAASLAYVLREYAIGRYASYYNGQATLSIDNMLTIFELSSLESNEVLQTSVLLMVVFLVYVKMQGREKRTSLIIDEAWRLLRHDAIKGFIEGIARRARKYNGNLVVATQSISDFEESKSQAAAAVLSQSDWRVLLSAEGKDEKILRDQLGMDASDIGVACDLRGDKGRYSECMIRHSSGSWLIGRLILDPFSAKLYSSKAEDVVKIEKLTKSGYSITEAIEMQI
jgi:conjugal transfer ATP-binding protein TraC